MQLVKVDRTLQKLTGVYFCGNVLNFDQIVLEIEEKMAR